MPCMFYMKSIIKVSGCKRMRFVTPNCKCPLARHEFKLLLPSQVSMSTCEAQLVVKVDRSLLCHTGFI